MATDVTTDNFETEVLQSQEPVLVDFWAEWCGPCHAVAPVLDRIAEERNLKVVKVNIDREQELAMRYGVQSIPYMVLFENGQQKSPALGAQPNGVLLTAVGLVYGHRRAATAPPRLPSPASALVPPRGATARRR